MLNRLALLFGVLAAIYVPANCAVADNPYVHSGSIGTTHDKDPESDGMPVPKLPFEKWAGKKIIILPEIKSLQHYGYQDIHPEGGNPLDTTPYEDLAGHTATVVSYENSGIPAKLHFTLDSTQAAYYSESYGDDMRFMNIALISDLDFARSHWLGKTLWFTGRSLVAYDETKDTGTSVSSARDAFSEVTTKRFHPVKVMDIVAAWDERMPIRFIVKTEAGGVGFMDVRVSNSNAGGLKFDNTKFQAAFFTKDPRSIYKWPASVWAVIEQRKIAIGMTPQQVTLSWGRPNTINKDIYPDGIHEQWVYRNDYVYFNAGKVTSISANESTSE